jgi:hypothetical protein
MKPQSAKRLPALYQHGTGPVGRLGLKNQPQYSKKEKF